MRIHFAGTRGSAPVTDPRFATFGGDTTCLLVTGSAGEQVVLDCGTGLPALTGQLANQADIMILLTHFHLDHLVGLATFPPLYTRGTRLLIAAPHTDGVSVSDALHDLFRAPFWPVTLDQVGSELSFADLPSASTEPMRLGGLEVRWMPIPHPGGCTAYRLDEPATGASLVLATDAEWTTEETDPSFLAFCRGCQLLICDGQYDDDVAPSRRGWGHTAWPQAVDLARAAGVGRLILTHHDPEADDTVLAAREQALQAVMPDAALARQGQSLDLSRKDAP